MQQHLIDQFINIANTHGTPVYVYNAATITKQYQKLFDMEGVGLEFSQDALVATAKKAMERKTGARGLRSIMENALLETMYDLPSIEGISKVVVEERTITDDAKPLLVYNNDQASDAELKAS